jgi:hypothetical protein
MADFRHDGDLWRPPKQQILEQPHGHHVLQRCQVLHTPRACDGATVHGRLSVQAFLCDEHRDVWRERERGAAFCGRRWAQHATDEDNLSGCVRFRRRFLRRLEITMIISSESLIAGEQNYEHNTRVFTIISVEGDPDNQTPAGG